MSEPVIRSTWIAAEFKPEECALIAYWLAHRQAGQAPRLAAIGGVGLRPWLANLQIHERLQDGSYLCRLSGAACVVVMGADSTGRRLDEVVSPEVYDSAKTMFDRALSNGRPMRYGGRLTGADGGWRTYRRLLLPMRQHGAACDTLLSMLQYSPAQGAATASPARSIATILGSWELTESDLRETFPDAAAA